MKNFVKMSAEFVNGNVVLSERPMPRSLVLVNAKTKTVYNIVAKCRNTDKMDIAKCLAKAVLASKAEVEKQNSTKAAQESNKKVQDTIRRALYSHIVMLTDKDGAVMPNSAISVLDKDGCAGTLKLSDVFKFTKQMPIYQLVVERGLGWDDIHVVRALKWWCTAAIEQLDFVERLDEALEKAANHTEKEQDAAEAEQTAKNTQKAA